MMLVLTRHLPSLAMLVSDVPGYYHLPLAGLELDFLNSLLV
jgi:hypothetical protein